MTTRLEIIWIDQSDRTARTIGGFNADGFIWKISEAEAIDGAKSGKWDFWMLRGGLVTDVVVASVGGRQCLRAEAGPATEDHLLALPEIP